MKNCKCLMGFLLSAVLLVGTVFPAEALHRDGKEIDGAASMAMAQKSKAISQKMSLLDPINLKSGKEYNPIVQDRDHCLDGEVEDCADADCCPESWIGDGFEDCEDQAFGCDLTCYDNDGGDCVDPFCGDGTCNGVETEADCPEDCTPSEGCSDCEFDWTPYGAECCDAAWDELGIDCFTLENNYNWDCAGCNCPGDPPAVCGDGACTVGETYETCPEDCDPPTVCEDAGGNQGWIADGWCDSINNNAGCNFDGGDCCPCTCYDLVDNNCPDQPAGCYAGEGVYDYCGTCDLCYADGDPNVTCPDECAPAACGDGVCNGDEDYSTCPDDCNEPGTCDDGFVPDCVDDDCCSESWIGDGLCDGTDQEWGCDLTCYDNDGGDCPEICENYTCWDGTCVYYEDECPDEPEVQEPTGVCIAGDEYDPMDGTGLQPAVAVSWDIETVCGDGLCNGDEDYYNCPADCNEPGTETCDDCEFDFTPYGSECCDTAWADFGVNCMTLEASYNWDCSGCNCPGDGEAVCGDGFCTGDEDYYNCPDDCLPPGECPVGQILDCDGTDECWPESWIGDGFGDCNDQQYGADLTCYDCDGGDCPSTDPGCSSCADQGLVDCPDGSCAATTDDCPDPEECPAGTIADCSGDGDCGLESWIADGYCDGSAQLYGIDNCCYDNDGGDCTDEECAGGRAQVTSGIKKGHEPTMLHNGRLVDMIKAEKQSTLSLRDGVVVGGGQAVRMDQELNPSTRALTATVDLSCDACFNGEPWVGSWIVDAMAFGYFTVYGFDPGAVVCGTVTFCEDTNGACSATSDEVCAVSGDVTTGECIDEGPDCPSEAGSGDVNGDGDANVLDIVTIVNVILGGEFADDCAAAAADVNGDGAANVLDIVQIVNGILGRNAADEDASSAQLIQSGNSVSLKADGYIGGVQMTLTHGADFSIELTDNALVAEYRTVNNETILVIVAPVGEELFTHTGSFEIADVIIANSTEQVDLVTPVNFSLSAAYPNPFNPSTTMTLTLPEAGNVTVQVYNLMGQSMATLANGYMDASTYTLTWDGRNAASGMYIVKAETAGMVSTQKLMLLK